MNDILPYIVAFIAVLMLTVVFIGSTVSVDALELERNELRDSVTMLQDSLNNRAEPIYFNDLRLIGFDCRLLVNK